MFRGTNWRTEDVSSSKLDIPPGRCFSLCTLGAERAVRLRARSAAVQGDCQHFRSRSRSRPQNPDNPDPLRRIHTPNLRRRLHQLVPGQPRRARPDHLDHARRAARRPPHRRPGRPENRRRRGRQTGRILRRRDRRPLLPGRAGPAGQGRSGRRPDRNPGRSPRSANARPGGSLVRHRPGHVRHRLQRGGL